MATDGSFLKSLFHGVIVDGLVAPYPQLDRPDADVLHAVLGRVQRFCEASVDSGAIDRRAEIGVEVLAGLRETGAYGLSVPQAYGGLGLSLTGHARIIQEIAGYDSSIALALIAHQSLGLDPILRHGTDEQKARLLPALASGKRLAAFALTEPAAGSDAAGIRTLATRTEGGYTLRGSKLWVTNGAVADVLMVFARTSREEDAAKPGITAFVVERSDKVRSGVQGPRLGVRGTSTTDVHFDDVFVPDANVIGERGRGFKVAMEALNQGRVVLSAACVGQCKHVTKLALSRAQDRRAFRRPIGEFGLIKDKIARMLAETYALESVVYLTAGLADAGVGDYSIECAAAKVFGSETLSRVVDEAWLIAAGNGFDENQPFARHLRDAHAQLVFGGTNEILRCFIALSGMQGPGLALVDVARAMREPIKGFGLLSDFAVRKARTALGRERFARAHPLLNRETVVFEDYTQELAKNTEKVLRKHGKEIAEMQYTQRRIADMAIDLFAIAATVSRTSRAIERRGEEGARREIDLTTVFVAGAEKRLAANVSSFDKNDDELRKAIASRAYVDGAYPLDVV